VIPEQGGPRFDVTVVVGLTVDELASLQKVDGRGRIPTSGMARVPRLRPCALC
jgi:hypothetical protein